MVKKTDNIKEYQRSYYLLNRDRILLYARQQRQEKNGDKIISIKKPKAEPFKIKKNILVIFKF
tara:strand:- start:158 stop:346 length:189 start_codon:yes stop_codon:yes gene_type:complete